MPGSGNGYLAQVLGEAAVGAGRTKTFLNERYRRIARRRSERRAIVAAGTSIQHVRATLSRSLRLDPGDEVDHHGSGDGEQKSQPGRVVGIGLGQDVGGADVQQEPGEKSQIEQ